MIMRTAETDDGEDIHRETMKELKTAISKAKIMLMEMEQGELNIVTIKMTMVTTMMTMEKRTAVMNTTKREPRL